ncbi:putative phage protein (TIGR01671 family) [Aneurinibacillus soli]|uniref:YopX protein n=1 Tax=Aneurinibacillus soli TaxID=1500254 RepID=A0A0U5B2R4_9BACL|nr:YopX family protein [Aneurinibacillus soli]PYE63453.1 putative phage protein (TIGR01671 family) [Aneurinibacillus soli]BAU27615.1 YopX protein [Aneurinibacillus soli]
MREVKFRGKSIDEEKEGWFYGDYCSVPSPNILFENSNKEIDCEPVIPETVGQYTGLRDRNGRKIYEGDIVRWPGSGDKVYVRVVTFEKYTFHVGNILDGLCDYRDFVVIGNIYDNQELLEGN